MANCIRSILDNDLYKFSMQQAVCQLYPRAWARYEFINRGKTQFPPGFDRILKWELDNMRQLSLGSLEHRFLERRSPYFSPVYLDFLSGYRYSSEDEIKIIQEGGNLKIVIEGPWYRTILWEVPLMAMISELYFKHTEDSDPRRSSEILNQQDIAKAECIKRLKILLAEFGTRRRLSYSNQERVIRILQKYAPKNLVGTSNVYIAFLLGLTPIGTHAHEWFMFHAAKYGFHEANRIALKKWAEVYRGDLGIALSDTFTTDNFLDSFDLYHAKLFDGVRHDSGDPIDFACKMIRFYKTNHINPMTKTIVFSDGLNLELIAKIENFCKDHIKTSYGVGTNLSNDVGVKPLNMVIKMTACKPNGPDYPWIPTIKLSDVEGKHTGDPETINMCKKVLRLN